MWTLLNKTVVDKLRRAQKTHLKRRLSAYPSTPSSSTTTSSSTSLLSDPACSKSYRKLVIFCVPTC